MHRESAIRALEDELAGIGGDPRALEIAGRVDRWREPRSRYDSAVDIPVREGELARKREAVGDVLRRLGRESDDEPRRLLLPAQTVAALDELADARLGLDSKLAAAREAGDEAKAALQRALDETPGAGADGRPMDALKARLAEARRDDLEVRLRATEAEVAKLEHRLAEAFAALEPWRGDVAALARVSLPGRRRDGELPPAPRRRESRARPLARDAGRARR